MNRLTISAMWVAVLVFVGLFIAIPLWSKYQVCRTYYPELSRVACLDSNYGLPPRSTK